MKTSILWQNQQLGWLQEGDANSRFFHRCVEIRRKNNEIMCIETQSSRLARVQ